MVDEEKTVEELEVSQEEKEQTSRNRLFILLVVICVALLGGIIFEMVSIFTK